MRLATAINVAALQEVFYRRKKTNAAQQSAPRSAD